MLRVVSGVLVKALLCAVLGHDLGRQIVELDAGSHIKFEVQGDRLVRQPISSVVWDYFGPDARYLTVRACRRCRLVLVDPRIGERLGPS